MDYTRSQGVGVGVGTGGLLVIAAVVAIASSPAEPKKPPDPKKAAVTVRHTSHVGLGGDATFTLRLHALGTPPSDPARLVDSGGQANALMTPMTCPPVVDEDRWTGLTAHASPKNDWCFTVKTPRPGVDVKGTLATDSAQIDLTVGQRHNYWIGPFLTTLAGLGVGLVVLWWPKRLRDLTLEARLQTELDRNDAAVAGPQIGDLQEKAKDWKSTGVSLAERVDAVE